MTTFRDRLDLEAYAREHDDRLPAAWLVVAILCCYLGIIGVALWALVGALR